MRYQQVDNIVFTDKNGKSYTIKDMREFPTDYTLSKSVNVTDKDMIDEIACREDIYGAGAEFQIYKIYDFNIVKLFESDFNLINIGSLRIPN